MCKKVFPKCKHVREYVNMCKCIIASKIYVVPPKPNMLNLNPYQIQFDSDYKYRNINKWVYFRRLSRIRPHESHIVGHWCPKISFATWILF